MGHVDHLLTDEITLARRTGNSGGNPTFGAQITGKARVEDVNTLMVAQDSNEKRVTTMFVTDTEVFYTDRIWLPGDNTSDNSAAKRAVKIMYARFPGNSHGHYEVFL